MSEEQEPPAPDVVKITKEAEGILKVSESYVIDSPEMYTFAGEEIKSVKKKYKEFEAARKKITRKIDESKKEVMALFSPPLEFLKQAEEILNKVMIDYKKAQDKIRQEAEARARAEAAAAQKKADEEAAALREKGDTEAAEAVEAEAAAAPPPAVQQTAAPEIKGVHTRKNWKFRITDASKIPAEYLVPDEVKIGQVVRAMKDTTSIPGIEVYCDEKIATRT